MPSDVGCDASGFRLPFRSLASTARTQRKSGRLEKSKPSHSPCALPFRPLPPVGGSAISRGLAPEDTHYRCEGRGRALANSSFSSLSRQNRSLPIIAEEAESTAVGSPPVNLAASRVKRKLRRILPTVGTSDRGMDGENKRGKGGRDASQTSAAAPPLSSNAPQCPLAFCALYTHA